MIPRAAACCLVAALAGAAAAPARGQSSTPGGLRGLLEVRSADIQGRGVVALGVFPRMHWLEDAAGNDHVFLLTDFHLAYGLSPYLEASVSVPLRSWWVNQTAGSSIEPASLVGFGDLLTSAKLQLPLPWKTVRLGGFGVVSAATGSSSRGMSSESTDIEAGGLLTVDLTHMQRFLPTRLHLNGSYRWNRNEVRGVGMAPLDSLRQGGFWPPAYPPLPAGASPTENDALLLRVGLEFVTSALDVFTEFSMDLLPHQDGVDFADNVLFLTQGATVKFKRGIDLKVAASVSLQADAPPPSVTDSPDWRFALGLVWHGGLGRHDDDGDGIPNSKDACPKEAEDFDGFADQDGCPDLDNDQDGVPDVKDLAPDLPEDVDGFEDSDGRPDRDNDGDGISDDKDACPNEAEDFDGDRDLDGCPDQERSAPEGSSTPGRP